MSSQQSSSFASSSSRPSSSATTSPSTSANGKPDRLYVGNLSPTVDEHTLIQVFSKYGKITKLDFMFHKSGVLKGKPRGFAFIQFSDKDDALKAMVKLHDRLLRGRKLVVTYASSAPADNLPLMTKGRRPTEPAKTTTLSLLKTSRKPQSAAAQIAAMEAKLASMARYKPADEDWVPGSGAASSAEGGTPGPDADAEAEEGMAIDGSPAPALEPDDLIGEEEAGKAADELEKEMLGGTPPVGDNIVDEEVAAKEESAGRGSGPDGSSTSLAGLPSKPSSDMTVPEPKGSTIVGKDKGKGKDKEETIKRGLAGLPKKPVF